MERAQEEGLCTADLSGFPLMHISSPNVAQYDHVSPQSFWDCIDQGLARQAIFVVLHDARHIPNVDSNGRRLFGELLEPRRDAVIERVAAYAGIVGSPFERGLLTALIWFTRLPLPIRLFSNEAEASAWLMERYAAATTREKAVGEHG